ncbi:MAG: CPBP family intramembrane metalloprotease [Lachnospiraceae bacterium]|nr:CPBP family intramembrane metalloprotease [Lachnospiraceae bacterium]MCI9306289.1 CPBP family intramembrane metalloprotease [Lachnospiraceae bacterium]
MDFFEEEKRRLNPLYGIGLFFIIMVLFIFVFAPLQFRFGMVGLLLTELGLLFVTLLAVRLTKQSFREVFPIRRPRFGQIVGTILIWAGCFLSAMLVTLISMLLFPEGFLEVSSSMSYMFSSIPAFFSFLIVAVSPAICEEAMHRGFIMHTFRGISRDWVVVLCIGLIFGLFHLDPYRFLPTAVLGMGLAYIMRKSNNMLFPALFHFINNSLSFFASLVNPGAAAEEAQQAAAELLTDPSILLGSLGSYLILGSLTPVLLFAGSYLLRKSSGCLKKYSDLRLVLTIVGVVALSFLMTAAGFTIIILTMDSIADMEELQPFLCLIRILHS